MQTDFYRLTATANRFASFGFLPLLIFCFLISLNVAAQNLPKEIRGYKVYRAKISVENQIEKDGRQDANETLVKIGDAQIADVSLAGITLEIPAEIQSAPQSGTVDFLTFNGFRVNDLAVEIEEYKNSFRLEKNKPATLPKPIKIFLSAKQTLRGASEEFKNSKEEWTVTGRIFVFGRFKKSFLTFKRVVPIEINLKIKNPLRND